MRAENLVRFADLLEERARDPDFYGDPFRHYGGRSMHQQSHGEAFLSIFKHRLQSSGVTVRLQDTGHYQITRSILENPERYWRHLRGDA